MPLSGELWQARLFHLAGPPSDGRARLTAEDERHALAVLRMKSGDELLGGDGQGRAWPLEVLSAGKSRLELRVAGEQLHEPRPGTDESALPWIEVAVALPRGGRSEEMLARLTQLGASAVTPLVCERGQGPVREPGAAKAEHLRRAMREACKQCRRLWIPELREPGTPADLRRTHPECELLALDPRAPLGLLEWARTHADADARRPIVLAIGPEGGFTPNEQEGLRAAGATEVRLGAYILRVETAAEAAVAVLIAALGG
jgi:16S rRNA (uracil1498-N3)-methyltransferase